MFTWCSPRASRPPSQTPRELLIILHTWAECKGKSLALVFDPICYSSRFGNCEENLISVESSTSWGRKEESQRSYLKKRMYANRTPTHSPSSPVLKRKWLARNACTVVTCHITRAYQTLSTMPLNWTQIHCCWRITKRCDTIKVQIWCIYVAVLLFIRSGKEFRTVPSTFVKTEVTSPSWLVTWPYRIHETGFR